MIPSAFSDSAVRFYLSTVCSDNVCFETMSALHELLSRWRANPDANSTVALCAYLGMARQEQLAREVGASAQKRYAHDAEVMLAVGRMYLEAELYQESQAALVAAGRLNTRDARAFRYLGETLLRRGDAIRAEKALERAVQLAPSNEDIQLWYERAKIYTALQGRLGQQAVAEAVKKSFPHAQKTVEASDRPSFDFSQFDDEPDAPTVMRSPLPNRQGSGASRALLPPISAPPRAPRAGSAPPPRKAPGLPPPAVPPSAPAPLVPPSASPIGNTGPLPPPPAPPVSPAAAPMGKQASLLPSAPASPPKSDLTAETDVPFVDAELEDTGQHETKLILEHLERVRLFERQGSVTPAWERPLAIKSRGPWVLLAATLALLGAGIGAYRYASDLRQARLEKAQSLNRQVETKLKSGRVEEIRATDRMLSRAFDLDSRSRHAARLWLYNRILYALLLPDESQGIDSATYRAKTVGIPEKDWASGKLTSFLIEGDLAGAAAVLPKWDKQSGKDAYYQLAAGAVLEGAGDQRAIERYEAAVELDPKLMPAKILLARALLLEEGTEQAKPVLSAIGKELQDHPTTRALEALSWAVSMDRSGAIPADAQLGPEEIERLVVPLRPVPYVVKAIQATERGDFETASKALGRAIGLSRSPAMATRVGFLALEAGDEALARKAALRAMQFAAVYPGARMLAARVALLGGRLDEAQKAVEELSPNLTEVAVVRAVVAYETLDVGGLAAAVEALGSARERLTMSALVAAEQIVTSAAYPLPEALGQMALPSVPWGELVSMDVVLDQGELVTANGMVSAWGDRAQRPVYQLREARLRRYQGKLEQAKTLSRAALQDATATAPALIEHVYALLALGQPDEAYDTIVQYRRLLGPMSVWPTIVADFAKGKEAQAKAAAAREELPPDATPAVLKMMVARALVTVKDKRARPYVLKLARRYPKHPDVRRLLERL